MSNIDHQLVVMLHACVHSILAIHVSLNVGYTLTASWEFSRALMPICIAIVNCQQASKQGLCDLSLQNMPDFAAVHPGSVLASGYGSACQSFVLLHQRMLAWYQLDQRSLQAVLQLEHSLIKFMVTTNSPRVSVCHTS